MPSTEMSSATTTFAPSPLSSNTTASSSSTTPKPWILMNRYEIHRLLGRGSFAKVYQATSLHSHLPFAIKIIEKSKIHSPSLATQIKREIAALRRLRHPNIVHLHEVMASKSHIYFVLDLVLGGELFAKVSKGRLPEPAARRYFQQLISALSFCHARGVYHRDLKPENLLLDENGDLKVSDFGLSALKDRFHVDGLFHTFCGTPAYVAPEVLSRRGYDPAKADIWSCGVILFVLMAGYLPFQDKNIMVMYRKINKGEFRCPGWFSVDLIRLLTRILDTNPETRITIPKIMENPWFKKGFKEIKFYVEDDECRSFGEEGGNETDYDSDCSVNSVNSVTSTSSEQAVVEGGIRRGGLVRPVSLNAFDIISFSAGFDLSGLFEETGEEARIVSAAPVAKIIAKLEEIANVVSYSVRKNNYKLSLEGASHGEQGPLLIAVEIYELTPTMVVVEVKKKGGDKEEYEEFCNKKLKPEIKKLDDSAVRVDPSAADRASNRSEKSLADRMKRVVSLPSLSDFDTS